MLSLTVVELKEIVFFLKSENKIQSDTEFTKNTLTGDLCKWMCCEARKIKCEHPNIILANAISTIGKLHNYLRALCFS